MNEALIALYGAPALFLVQLLLQLAPLSILLRLLLPQQSLLFLLTAGCEGLGIFLLLGLFFTRVSGAALFSLMALLLLRQMVWRRYRSDVDASLVARARSALDQAGRTLLLGGSLLPGVLLIAAWLLGGHAASLLLALAGACAAATGASLKFTLVTRASYNQGFALFKMPVRGVRT